MTGRELSCAGRKLGRVLAAGWPDWAGTDGLTLGWVVRDRLFFAAVDTPEGPVRMVTLPDEAEGVSPGRDGAAWIVALGQGFVAVDPGRAEIVRVILDDESDPVGTRAGLDVGVYVEAPRHRVTCLLDGSDEPIPDGASRSRWLTPWGAGRGVVWVDGDIVYRMSLPGRAGAPPLTHRITAVGRCRGTKEVCAGPQGALVVRGRSHSLLVAQGAFGVDGPPIDAVRFLDAETALATDPDRAFEISLKDGTIGASWPGSYDPVGFTIDGAGGRANPWVHDRETGELRRLGTDLRLSGFCGARPCRARVTGVELLAGPGGCIWPVPTRLDRRGAPITPENLDLVDGMVALGATDAGPVVVHVDESIRIFERAGLRADFGSGRDVSDVAVVDGTVQVRGADDQRAYDLDGRSATIVPFPARPKAVRGVRVSAPEDESMVEAGEGSWPVPADAAITVPGGCWAWSDEGALYSLE